MPSKILVVEDDTALADIYGFKFDHEGFDVRLAHNGEKGLEQARDFMPDLILLDIRMPIMNGDEMLMKLREQEWGADMHVIILTNLSKDEAPSILRFLNVDRYVVKAHHTPQQIVDIINEVLS